MNEILKTKEDEIVSYIENKYNNNSSIKTKLCYIYKCHKILKINSDLFQNNIEVYKIKALIETDEDEGNKK
jgi:hypothetical protein